MHPVLFPIFGSAIAAGALFTAALNGQQGYAAPHMQLQQVARLDAVESEPTITPAMTLPRGRLPSYVLGTGFNMRRRRPGPAAGSMPTRCSRPL